MRRLLAIALLSLLAPAARAGDFEDKVSYQGSTLHAWLVDLRGNKLDSRLSASRVLREVGPEAALRKELLRKELKGSDDLAWAAWALEQCGPDAAAAAHELVAQLADPREFIRRYAFMALESIGQPAVAPLLKALASDQPRLRV